MRSVLPSCGGGHVGRGGRKQVGWSFQGTQGTHAGYSGYSRREKRTEAGRVELPAGRRRWHVPQAGAAGRQLRAPGRCRPLAPAPSHTQGRGPTRDARLIRASFERAAQRGLWQLPVVLADATRMAGAVARLYEASKACALPIADFVHESGIARLQVRPSLAPPSVPPSRGARRARAEGNVQQCRTPWEPRAAQREGGSGEVQD